MKRVLPGIALAAMLLIPAALRAEDNAPPPAEQPMHVTLSVASIGSSGSILSIGSSGSILSIGSAGSILSIGSAGGLLRLGKGRPSQDTGETQAEAGV